METSTVSQFEQHLVLVGAGNAHLQVLKSLAMQPLAGVWVTLVTDALELPYSAMIPGYLTRRYQREEIYIDLLKLCTRANVWLRRGTISLWDPDKSLLHFETGERLAYDFLSLNCGSIPKRLPGDWSGTLTKPLHSLVESFQLLDQKMEAHPQTQICIVGGGGGGCELALAARKRYGGAVSLVHAETKLPIPKMLPVLEQAGIETYLQEEGTGCLQGRLSLKSGKTVACDWLIQATSAEPSPFVQKANISKDDRGFVQVDSFLRSVSHPNVFGSGDTVTLRDFPTLAKSGVYAVRQGPILAENIRRIFTGGDPLPFRPQKRFLTIFDTSDDRAVLHYGPLVSHSRAALALKMRIDRKWVSRFAVRLPDQLEEMPCAGCGAKVGSRALEGVLGVVNGEDVGVLEGECQSIDFLRIFVRDLSLFGKATAIHALNDLYAAGATPTGALMNLVLPHGSSHLHRQLLDCILDGASALFRKENVTLLGGHTSQGAEAALGFAVTGTGSFPLRTKGGLSPLDHLILTKPLGTGVLLAAAMRGMLPAHAYPRLEQHLSQSACAASRILTGAQVRGCTDVSGFGLVGHLSEMVDKSGWSAVLWVNEIPVLQEVLPLLGMGIKSSLDGENRRPRVAVEGDEKYQRTELYDPQTCGGLLFSISPKDSSRLIRELKEAGYREACVIGQVLPDSVQKPKILLKAGRNPL